MSTCLSLNHGVVNALLALATAQLGNKLGGYSAGMMYIAYSLISLTMATTIVGKVGPKWSLVSALILYCFYTVTFILDIEFPEIAWPMSMIGATVGGFGAGWLWTAQGVYTAAFARAGADAHARRPALARRRMWTEVWSPQTTYLFTGEASHVRLPPVRGSRRLPPLVAAAPDAEGWWSNEKSCLS